MLFLWLEGVLLVAEWKQLGAGVWSDRTDECGQGVEVPEWGMSLFVQNTCTLPLLPQVHSVVVSCLSI